MRGMLGNALVMGVIALTLILVIVLRANASLVFLVLCSGVVLNMMIGDDAVLIANSGLADVNRGIESFVRIGLILVPTILSLLFLRKSVPKNRIAMQVPSALAVGSAILLLVAPLMNTSLITDSSAYVELKKYQAAVFIVGILTGLLLNTLARQKHPHEQTSKHH
jgi:hypothetical protein